MSDSENASFECSSDYSGDHQRACCEVAHEVYQDDENDAGNYATAHFLFGNYPELTPEETISAALDGFEVP